SDDLERDILTSSPCPELTQERLTALLPHFQGTIQQIPPKYSAIQVDGKRLYDLARAGVDVDVPVRTVEISDISILSWSPGDFPELEVEITCGGGTYIRAIARDLGHMANVGATLSQLIRTESCGLTLDTSTTIEQLAEKINQQLFSPILPQQVLKHLSKVILMPEQEAAWLNGRSICLPLETVSNNTEANNFPNIVQVCNKTSIFLGIGHKSRKFQNCFQGREEHIDEAQECRDPGTKQSTAYTLQPKVVFN
ncbi:MAG: hypothetical protein F6K36_30185, partial [Symploca sp. SIO3C6]|nr:hypothetical protein [Symploca sp. SIO3C6]